MPVRPRLALLFSLILLTAACSSDDETDTAVDTPDGGNDAADTAEAPPVVSTVFRAGEGGYDTYRIPAVIAGDDGSLVAFAEGREDGPHDNGPRDIVAKRSTDRGDTWGPLVVIGDAPGHETVDPVPFAVADSGDLLVLMDRFVHDGAADAPAAETGVLISRSGDGGETWSMPEPIEGEVGGFGPGHGTQLRSGPNPGRLVLAGHGGGAGHLAVSDDGGETWSTTARNEPGEGRFPNESTLTELGDGAVLVNSRDADSADEFKRLAVTSSDGADTFDGGYENVTDLVAPEVQGSLLTVTSTGGDETVVFSAPSHPDYRHWLRLRLSTDGGTTWRDGPLLWGGPSAYSDLVLIDDTTLGALYEAGDDHLYERIDFARFGVGWLDTPPEPGPALPEGYTIADDTTGHIRVGDERHLVTRACLDSTLVARIEVEDGTVTATPDSTLTTASVEASLDDGTIYRGQGDLHIGGGVWAEGTVTADADGESAEFFASLTGLEPCE